MRPPGALPAGRQRRARPAMRVAAEVDDVRLRARAAASSFPSALSRNSEDNRKRASSESKLQNSELLYSPFWQLRPAAAAEHR